MQERYQAWDCILGPLLKRSRDGASAEQEQCHHQPLWRAFSIRDSEKMTFRSLQINCRSRDTATALLPALAGSATCQAMAERRRGKWTSLTSIVRLQDGKKAMEDRPTRSPVSSALGFVRRQTGM
jgi:hypothetical protein